MGAINGALEMGTKAIDASVKAAQNLTQETGNIFEGALQSIDKSNKQLADAYQKGQAGDQVALKYAGFAVVGLAAVMLFKKAG
jgi:hypothetical protein